MGKEVLWPIALDQSGKEVSIEDAEPGKEYKCINCHGRMCAKKGASREWHFSHIAETDEKCTYSKWKKRMEKQSGLLSFEANILPREKLKYCSYYSFFIVHEDLTYEVKNEPICDDSDLLMLGMYTIPDFAMNIGKKYAYVRGLLDLEDLTEYERVVDLSALKPWFMSEFR